MKFTSYSLCVNVHVNVEIWFLLPEDLCRYIINISHKDLFLPLIPLLFMRNDFL